MKIRNAEQKDANEIIKLWKEFMGYHDELIIKVNPRFKQHLKKSDDALSSFSEYIKKNIDSPDSIVQVAEDNNEIVAYSLSYIKDNIPVFKEKHIGYLSDLFVKQEYRNKGISTIFKNNTFSWFKKKGYKNSFYPSLSR